MTGAGRGIGRYTAETFARHGARVAVCSRTSSEIHAVAEALEADVGRRVLARVVDVANEPSVRAFADHVAAEFGRADVLVNNAGVQGPVGSLLEVDMEAWAKTVSINLLGMVHAIRAFVPLLRASGGGHIINLSGGGVGGRAMAPRLSAYTASKLAVVGLTETLAKEFAPERIWINALAPGAINTSFVDPVVAAGPEVAGGALYEATVRQRQGGDPLGAVGAAMVFLGSERSSCLTGKLISAKWDSLETLASEAADLNASSGYTLRRIDGTLFRDGADS